MNEHPQHAEDGAIAADAPASADNRPAAHLIVGIGASAGGLTAFQAFFKAMPPDSGIAFVLIQHLAPDYDSALAEIIGESTAMKVTKAVDGTVAAPNTVSVITPDAILRIENGILRVAKTRDADGPKVGRGHVPRVARAGSGRKRRRHHSGRLWQ